MLYAATTIQLHLYLVCIFYLYIYMIIFRFIVYGHVEYMENSPYLLIAIDNANSMRMWSPNALLNNKITYNIMGFSYYL